MEVELKPSQLRVWLHEWSATRRAARAKGPTLRYTELGAATRGLRNDRLYRQQLKRARLVQAQDGLCYLCGDPFTSMEPATLDHVYPRAKNGSNLRNLLAAHASCNVAKSDRLPTLRELAFLKTINLRLVKEP